MPHGNITVTPIRILRPLETAPIPQALRMCSNRPAFLLGQARASHPLARLTIVTAVGVAEVFNGWDQPAGVKPADVMTHIAKVERGIAAMVTLKMQAAAMHHIEHQKALAAYRLAANAYRMGTLTAEDLSEMGRGLSERERKDELMSILFVGVG